MKVFDRGDQLPFGPHADVVLAHISVNDLERHKRWQLEILQTDADSGGALTNHADVCRRSEELAQASTHILKVGKLQRQRIVMQLTLKEKKKSGNMRTKAACLLSRKRVPLQASGRIRKEPSKVGLSATA
jgi:hypothetical protein